jgi:hypothetical protein
MKCICCGKNTIKPGDNPFLNGSTEEDYIWKTRECGNSENRKYERAENRMWYNGIVANISAGYGSTLDGNMYVIAICDQCVERKHQEGIIAYTGNYMFHDKKFDEEMVEESKKLWRRDQNLDKLSLYDNKDDGLLN